MLIDEVSSRTITTPNCPGPAFETGVRLRPLTGSPFSVTCTWLEARGIPEDVQRPSSRSGKIGALASVAVSWMTGLGFGFGFGLGLGGVVLALVVDVLVGLVVACDALVEVVEVLEVVDVLVVVEVLVVGVVLGVEPPPWPRPPLPPPTLP
jgi:hypothetical protein